MANFIDILSVHSGVPSGEQASKVLDQLKLKKIYINYNDIIVSVP